MARKTALALFVGILFLSGCSKTTETPSTQQPKVEPESAAVTTTAPQASGKIEVTPIKPKSGQPVTVKMTLQDRNGQSISDADVKAIFGMTMGGKQSREETMLKWNGKEYTGSHKPSMAGEWDVTVEARKNNTLLLSMPSTINVQ